LAKAEAEKISLTGNAETEKILAIGKSNAEAYKLSVDAMGDNNFTQLNVMATSIMPGTKYKWLTRLCRGIFILLKNKIYANGNCFLHSSCIFAEYFFEVCPEF